MLNNKSLQLAKKHLITFRKMEDNWGWIEEGSHSPNPMQVSAYKSGCGSKDVSGQNGGDLQRSGSKCPGAIDWMITGGSTVEVS